MELIMLILTFIGTIATVVSAFIAVRAKNEAKEISKEISIQLNKNAMNSGNVDVLNSGVNTGIISGLNTGEVTSYGKK